MRFGTLKNGQPCIIDKDGHVVPLNGHAGPAFASLQSVIETGAEALKYLEEQPNKFSQQDWTEADWGAPIPTPRRNIMCVGKNYHAHAIEFGTSGYDSSTQSDDVVPEFPVIFSKAPESVIGPNDNIIVPEALTSQVDYEAEIAVIIGKAGRFISQENAHKHVFGYTLVNDVTARDLQKRHKQWFLGKSIDTFCPMGPLIVTPDELDINDVRLQCHVNGEQRQDATGDQLIFNVAQIIECLSASMELLPGDIIATGTPAGVGLGMTPPQFLGDNDVVEVSADGLGVLRNKVRVKARASQAA